MVISIVIAGPATRGYGQKGQTSSPTPAPISVKFELLDRKGAVITSLTDGDYIKLKVSMDQEAPLATTIAYTIGKEGRIIGRCIIALGQQSCETEAAPALGWLRGKGGVAEGDRELQAATSDPGIPKQFQFKTTLKARVSPRPVVLVHGLGSNASTWVEYVKPGGFLAATGLTGFAVGDGQASGTLSTGDPSNPLQPTNTIAQNAEILGRYLAGVKSKTNAQTVDLVTHSMGGLIARYYIDRIMTERDVAQLIMLGTPNGGSDCACLPSSLGFFLPASLELRPAYVADIFNRQILQRKGVPFYGLAGTQISEGFKSPCTETPSDLLVSRPSAAAITAPVTDLPVLHSEMTRSEAIYKQFVAPRLTAQAGDFASERDPEPLAGASAPVQFTKAITGRVNAGGNAELTMNLDQVTVASFALLDPSRSLRVTVRGASGNVINLDSDASGLVKIDDPSTMFTLGYGFQNPKPGPWKITLNSTAATPSAGTDFAISTKVVGGAELQTKVDRMFAQFGQAITFDSALTLAQNPVQGAAIEGSVRTPSGAREKLIFTESGGRRRSSWTPDEPGVYAVDIAAHGVTPDGLEIERVNFLSIEVAPDPNRGLLFLSLLAIGGLTIVTMIGFWLKQRWSRKVRRTGLDL
jgi:pimeloyl-ACP methyl ester carboxylesterase